MIAQTENQRRCSLKFHFHSQTEASKQTGLALEREWTQWLTSHKGSSPNKVERTPSLLKLERLTPSDIKRGVQLQTFLGSKQPCAVGSWQLSGTVLPRSLEKNGLWQLLRAQGRGCPWPGSPCRPGLLAGSLQLLVQVHVSDAQ